MRDESVDLSGQYEVQDEAVAMVREKPDGIADPAGEAGWYLQRERENRLETLEQAGDSTGIHPYHLEAIEYGDMTHMPERLEALEMIGIYAQYLGFDPEPLVEHYAQFLPAPALAPANHPANPAPLTSAKVLKFGQLPKMPKINFKLNGVPGGAGGLVASVAAAVFLFAGVSYMLMPGADDQMTQPQQVAETSNPGADPMPTASTGDENAEITIGEEPLPDDQQVADTAAPLDDELSGTGLDGLSSLIQKEIPGAKEASKDLNGLVSATDVAMTGDGESRLTLKAKAPVWVRIEDAQGKVVMTQMLMKGDTYRVPNRQGLVVIARDGGLLSYLIDGKEKGILGTPGEILVGRSLDLKSFGGKG
jgi:cytoskeleton protein RodZ